jgi:hypothetical protein
MWIERTQAEKMEGRVEQRRKNVRIAVAYWIIFTVFPPLVRNRYLGGMTKRPHIWEMSGFQVLKIYAITMIVSGLGVYFLFWRPKMQNDRPQTLLCPKCGTAKIPDDKFHCQCGGRFVDLRDMKWVDGTHSNK